LNPWKKLKGLLASLVEQDSSPEEIALGVAVGIFIGFSPWYGIQIFIAIACAYCIPRVNKISVVAGAQINWIAPLYYYFEYKLGLAILRRHGISLTIDTFRHLTTEKILHHLNVETGLGIFLPLFVGSLVFGAAGSVLAYFVTRRLVERAKARRAAG
jgi:uncharacterized protein